MGPVEWRRVEFASADGTSLEGDVLGPLDAAGTAVVCHPHPLYGGSRHDAVVAALCDGFVTAGRRVLRFDFRGGGGSSGEHGEGEPERADLAAAIDAVEPGADSLVIAGYSFGADVALSVAHPAATGWLVVAPPLSVFAPDSMAAAHDPRPVRILQPERDQFNPPLRLAETVAEWANCTVEILDGADHFLAGAQERVAARARDPFGARR